MYQASMEEFKVRFPVSANRERRFLVHTYEDSIHVGLTTEELCLCQTQPDRQDFLDDGICMYCRGRLWDSSPDEGTGLPITNLPELIDALLQVQARAGISVSHRRVDLPLVDQTLPT